MKTAIITVAAALLAAGAASAAAKVSDVDFLRANRCKGLATTLSGVVDPEALNSFIRTERGTRMPYVMERAEAEFQRAKKEAKAEERKARLSAELSGPCQAYVGDGQGSLKR